VACLVLYMAFFEISLGPILWLLLSELYPVEVKGVAMSVGATMCWCVARARAERRASFFQRVVSAVSSLPLSSSPNFAGS
jgi:hypothetical protein